MCGGCGSGYAVLSHGIGKVFRCARGQGQGTDGDDGKLCLSLTYAEKVLLLSQDDLACHIRIPLSEGGQAAGIVYRAPGFSTSKGGSGISQNIALHHGDYALNCRLKIAYFDTYCLHLRRHGCIAPARQEEFDMAAYGLVNISVLQLCIP